jgi:hypothetical protein
MVPTTPPLYVAEKEKEGNKHRRKTSRGRATLTADLAGNAVPNPTYYSRI